MGNERMTLKRAAELCAQEFTVRYGDGSEEVIWIRTRTQLEIDESETAIAKRRLALKERYSPGQPDYESLVLDLQLTEPATLAGMVAAMDMDEIGRRVARELPQLIPLDPSKYHNESDRQKAESDYEDRKAAREQEWEQKVKEALDKRQGELVALPMTELSEKAIPAYLRQRIAAETLAWREAYLIYQCVRRADDHGEPYFDSVEDVPEQAAVRGPLLASIGQVEAVTPIDIKNSPGRSVSPSGPAASTPEVTPESSTAGSRESGSRKKRSPGGRRRSQTVSS
jgi:hypothetical protein